MRRRVGTAGRWWVRCRLLDALDLVVGHLTLGAGQHDQALLAYRRAAQAGYPPAEATLVDMGVQFLPLPGSLERARKHLDLTLREFGPDHENTLLAEQSIVTITMYSDCYSEAHRLAERLLAKGESILGLNHRLVLATKFVVAYCTFRLGSVDEGISGLEAVAEESSRALGPLDTATMSRRITIVSLLIELGEYDVAKVDLLSFQRNVTVSRPGISWAQR